MESVLRQNPKRLTWAVSRQETRFTCCTQVNVGSIEGIQEWKKSVVWSILCLVVSNYVVLDAYFKWNWTRWCISLHGYGGTWWALGQCCPALSLWWNRSVPSLTSDLPFLPVVTWLILLCTLESWVSFIDLWNYSFQGKHHFSVCSALSFVLFYSLSLWSAEYWLSKMSMSESVEPVTRLHCWARGLRLQMELSISPDDLKIGRQPGLPGWPNVMAKVPPNVEGEEGESWSERHRVTKSPPSTAGFTDRGGATQHEMRRRL